MHVERQRADRLIGIDHERGTPAVADLGKPRDVLDVATRVVHVPGAHDRGALVDRTLEELERHGDAVWAVHELDLDAGALEREPGVAVGRKVDVRHDDLVPLGIVEGRRDRDEGGRHRRLERHLVQIRSKNAREVGAQLVEEADPVLVPGAAAKLAPRARVLGERGRTGPR